MKLLTQKHNLTLGIALGAIVALMMTFGVTFSPQNAQAFWWPWGDEHHKKAHAQDTDDDETLTVTIHKYIDGEAATAESAMDSAFPMTATWDDPEGIGSGSGNFDLSAETSPAYSAVTAEMNAGADYEVSEVLDTDLVAATCAGDHPFALVGYTYGDSLEDALEAEISVSDLSLTDLDESQHVIVWNETCEEDDVVATSTGNIEGEVTGGVSETDPGELMITSIEALKTTAIANGEFEDGWQYLFHVTVPSDEPNLSMKFMDWVHTNGINTLPVAGNMRISSEQAAATSTVTLAAEDTYASPDLMIVDDLNGSEDGLQVQVLVEVAVPSDTVNGTYSTEYGVRALP